MADENSAPYIYFGGVFTSTPGSSAQMGGAAIWNYVNNTWQGTLRGQEFERPIWRLVNVVLYGDVRPHKPFFLDSTPHFRKVPKAIVTL
jgi:hypothetical protein